MNNDGPPAIVDENRRWRLRRLDDLLEALETCNEQDISQPPRPILEGLRAAGIDPQPEETTTQLIERVLDKQADYLIKVPLERRKGPRRRHNVDLAGWLREGRRSTDDNPLR
jgi:hypothetical protein